MAKGYTVKTSVFFDGKQAENELKNLQTAADVLSNKITDLRNKLGEKADEDEEVKTLEKQYRSLTTQILKSKEHIDGFEDVLNNLSGQSVRSLTYAVRAASAAMRGFNGIAGESNEEILQTALQIDQAKLRINQLKSGFTNLMAQAGDTTGMTVSQLERLKKLLIEEQSLVASDEATWAKYEETIKKVSADINNIKGAQDRFQAEFIITDVKDGVFDGTIAETQEAIKLLQEYQQHLKTTDTEAIEETQQAIDKLNGMLEKTKAGFMSVDEAMNIGTQLQEGTFSGTLQELEKANKTLMELKANTSVSDTEGLQKINNALREIQQATNKAKAEVIDVGDLINNRLKTASLDEGKPCGTQYRRICKGFRSASHRKG